MKKAVVFGIVVILALAVFIAVEMKSNSTGNYVKIEDTGSSNSSGSTGAVKEFTMTAKDFSFTPGTIEVNEGDTVILHITAEDTNHGFALPSFAVSQELPVGVEETVQFVADQKGTFTFFCNVFCGAGHRDMKGTLIVN